MTTENSPTPKPTQCSISLDGHHQMYEFIAKHTLSKILTSASISKRISVKSKDEPDQLWVVLNNLHLYKFYTPEENQLWTLELVRIMTNKFNIRKDPTRWQEKNLIAKMVEFIHEQLEERFKPIAQLKKMVKYHVYGFISIINLVEPLKDGAALRIEKQLQKMFDRLSLPYQLVHLLPGPKDDIQCFYNIRYHTDFENEIAIFTRDRGHKWAPSVDLSDKDFDIEKHIPIKPYLEYLATMKLISQPKPTPIKMKVVYPKGGPQHTKALTNSPQKLGGGIVKQTKTL